MGKPKWMIEREQRRAAELNEVLEYINSTTAKINENINELYKKVNDIEDEKQRNLVLIETNNSVNYYARMLKNAPKYCFNGKQLKGMYNLVLKQVISMNQTIEEVFGITGNQKS